MFSFQYYAHTHTPLQQLVYIYKLFHKNHYKHHRLKFLQREINLHDADSSEILMNLFRRTVSSANTLNDYLQQSEH